ncbi:hypothetical protein [Burkholderia thailandensis]|uniref:HD domain protein n=2 Tax=Burkholderia thailandensis TaxID=57975 RepID=A0AAW9CZA5_BURTH|nr:hypothetical protein [Burkholderia thailandensis]ABC34986.1 HD domain protein [Burkholderia thailandensis E264]AJT48916.1 phosphohydrolase [Burkholderia thailandensis]AOI55252.1 phosphohydrolase [Burkholderia thailandensis]AOJ48614.1 phosphohydrolase [Burkholderia thailandensis]AOJ54283.1 phosphohydrolase [Burkholderia thailandensis]
MHERADPLTLTRMLEAPLRDEILSPRGECERAAREIVDMQTRSRIDARGGQPPAR